MDAAERVRVSFAEAEARRARGVRGGEVVELDGIEMSFTNLPDEGLNAGVVTGAPADPAAAIAAAGAAAEERGRSLALEVERGRFPEVEAALAEAGLATLFSKPAMVADPGAMWKPQPTEGLRISLVTDRAGVAAMVHVETDAFGTDPEVARGLLTPLTFIDPDRRAFVGMLDRAPVAQSIAYHHAGAVGVYGVGVRSSARRRGIGGAMTVFAASSFPGADLVWLHPTDMARSMYERLGFREVSVWDVWTRPAPA